MLEKTGIFKNLQHSAFNSIINPAFNSIINNTHFNCVRITASLASSSWRFWRGWRRWRGWRWSLSSSPPSSSWSLLIRHLERGECWNLAVLIRTYSRHTSLHNQQKKTATCYIQSLSNIPQIVDALKFKKVQSPRKIQKNNQTKI